MVTKELSLLSPNEKKDLEDLFEYFFFSEEFSYPLFGSKPMSIGRLLEKEKSLNGWKAWEKIALHFLSEKFILEDYSYNEHSFVLLANLELIEKTYEKNRSIFEKAFNKRMTLEALKNCLRKRDELFQELLQNHLILGILLGYGTRNAQIFTQNHNLPKEKRIPVKSFTSYPAFYYFSKVMPPCFACDPNSEETRDLKKRYTQERAMIVKMNRKAPLFFRMLVLFKHSL